VLHNEAMYVYDYYVYTLEEIYSAIEFCRLSVNHKVNHTHMDLHLDMDLS